MDEVNNKISQKIAQDLDIDVADSVPDEEMIKHISFRVEQMLKGDPDLLMSYLYRLDVEEKRIKAAMEVSITPAHVTFANLIWERQKQRMETKIKYKQDPIEGWEF